VGLKREEAWRGDIYLRRTGGARGRGGGMMGWTRLCRKIIKGWEGQVVFLGC